MQIRLYVTRLRAQLGGCAPRLLDAVPVAEDIDDLAQPPLGVTFSADDDKENESAALGKTRQATGSRGLPRGSPGPRTNGWVPCKPPLRRLEVVTR